MEGLVILRTVSAVTNNLQIAISGPLCLGKLCEAMSPPLDDEDLLQTLQESDDLYLPDGRTVVDAVVAFRDCLDRNLFAEIRKKGVADGRDYGLGVFYNLDLVSRSRC